MSREGRHIFSVTHPDITDTTQVNPSDWNANHVIGDLLTNRTGVTLNVGDVVRLDTANDRSVVQDDVQGKVAPYVVCLGTRSGRSLVAVPNLETGWFAAEGVRTTKVVGAVTRGNWLRKSATAFALEDMGVGSASAAAPAGALAIALEAAAGPGTATIAAAWRGGSGSARPFLPATAAYLSATDGATLRRVDATNETWYELVYPDGVTRTADFELAAAATGQVELTWRTTATTGSVRWAIEIREKGDGSVMGSGAVVSSGSIIRAAKPTSAQFDVVTVALSPAYQPGANKNLMMVRVIRYGADANDTLAADALLIAVRLLD